MPRPHTETTCLPSTSGRARNPLYKGRREAQIGMGFPYTSDETVGYRVQRADPMTVCLIPEADSNDRSLNTERGY